MSSRGLPSIHQPLPAGCSVVTYASKDMVHYQYSLVFDWPGSRQSCSVAALTRVRRHLLHAHHARLAIRRYRRHRLGNDAVLRSLELVHGLIMVMVSQARLGMLTWQRACTKGLSSLLPRSPPHRDSKWAEDCSRRLTHLVQLVAEPDCCMVAFTSDEFNIYAFMDKLRKRGCE